MRDGGENPGDKIMIEKNVELLGNAALTRQMLCGFNTSVIASADDVIYVLTPNLNLVAFNNAWCSFAMANGGQSVLQRWMAGASILDAMAEDTRKPLSQVYARVLASGVPEAFEYECSSPEQFRIFLQYIYPLKGRIPGLLVCNSLVYLSDNPKGEATFDHRYRDATGLVRQCCHCRRLARRRASAWDWVPALEENGEDNITHGICPTCLDFHFPE